MRQERSAHHRPAAVLFDLDCTLTDRRSSNHAFIQRLAVDYRAALSGPIQEDEVTRLFTTADRNGYATRSEVCSTLIDAVPWRNRPALSELLRYWHRTYPQCTVPRTDMAPTLQSLRAAGIRLGVVSNGKSLIQRSKLQAIGETDLDVVVISDEVGYEKPQPEIFEIAIRHLRIEAADAWFVGDHPMNDVEGARNCGLTAIWLSGVHPWPDAIRPPSHSFSSLSGLLTLMAMG